MPPPGCAIWCRESKSERAQCVLPVLSLFCAHTTLLLHAMQLSDSQDFRHGMICEVMDGLFSVFMEEVCAQGME